MAGHLDKSLPLEYQEEQSRLNILGFWIFLGAEIALFSTLFVTYLTYHTRTAGGPTAEDLFVVKDFMIETLLLLFSSFTMGIVVFKMRNSDLKGLLVWFVITLLLGGGFLFYEIREFYMYAVHEGATMQTSAFLSGFFTLLGTHGLHVTVGVFWAISIIIQLVRRGLTPVTARKVFIIGLYWHFLDVVWIFIFTLVYLNGLVG
ncbi:MULTISPECIES: cytochrome aa3 quinol oxidase subunit III [Priestia]|jgi:cytochrome aa3-600 menaquinol oxidase subunit 3|uniref:cytochrome aa3 quinol oxidase subunit III n=1 Tax=Priestia TaxID=2800373 RepID=UPI001865C1AD|nr:cytochrome aa3 quinol oxidase subunit III [Priestia megaterium]MBE2973771.1 cytochrome aa3 quinol oxidase subunit III [Priestia megaterium]MBT2255106.1 cytochrome aa3 quinol oxidase subunit III [Priestia megaterium]MBT2280769.1 cytochrome aa3 quinol oxidase subunit III [Priestia megaterium]MCY9017594.1 cytochrome aa3 quinol oxidase subunit III [Priestia megaterium]MCY9023574.1 cytochrome aa3 quinol oxidase subunit III [Priestia megaterium]